MNRSEFPTPHPGEEADATAQLLAALTRLADEYQRRYEPPDPLIVLIPDWALGPALADLAAQGRPATRDELDRAASEIVCCKVQVRLLDEVVSPPVSH